MAVKGLPEKKKPNNLVLTFPRHEPLILTPYIEQNDLELGRMLARVSLPLPGLASHEMVRSYSGYFQVNKTLDKNIFFWFFPAMVT